MLPLAAHADIDRGAYVSLGLGASFLDDIQPSGNGLTGITSTYDPGYAGEIALGYANGDGFRFQLDTDVRANPISTVNSLKISKGWTGDYAGYIDALYDFNLYIPLVPHVGAGIGAADVITLSEYDLHGFQSANGHDLAFAYKLIVGAEYPVLPDLKIGLDYQYEGAPSVNVPTRFGFHVAPSANYSLGDSAVLLTLRYSFGWLSDGI